MLPYSLSRDIRSDEDSETWRGNERKELAPGSWCCRACCQRRRLRSDLRVTTVLKAFRSPAGQDPRAPSICVLHQVKSFLGLATHTHTLRLLVCPCLLLISSVFTCPRLFASEALHFQPIQSPSHTRPKIRRMPQALDYTKS